MARNRRIVWSLRRAVVVLLIGALAAAGCGSDDDGGDDATADLPSPVNDSPDTATPPEEDGEAVGLSNVRWYTIEDQFGNTVMRFFALVENTSDLVQEVRVEVEAVDADGDVIGRSGPQPFLDTILPGEQLALSLGGRVESEPADVLPIVRPDAVSEQRQDRYGIITFEGEVLDFTVGEDEITVDLELTNTGSEASLTAIYLAAFDAAGDIVAAGVDFVTEMEPGETDRVTVEFSRDPLVDMSVDRVMIYFPARAFHDLDE